MNTTLRIDYEELRVIAQLFYLQQEMLTHMTQNLQSDYLPLEQGDWLGPAGLAFFDAMRGRIFPAMQRLHSAMQTSQQTVESISQLMQEAEHEAAALFEGEYTPDSQAQTLIAPPLINTLSGNSISGELDSSFLEEEGEETIPISPDTQLPWMSGEFLYSDDDTIPDYNLATAAAERAALIERAANEQGTYSATDSLSFINDDSTAMNNLVLDMINMKLTIGLMPIGQDSSDTPEMLGGLAGAMASDIAGLIEKINPASDTIGFIVGVLAGPFFDSLAGGADPIAADLRVFHDMVDMIYAGEPIIYDNDYATERLRDPAINQEVRTILEHASDILLAASSSERMMTSVDIYMDVAPNGALTYNTRWYDSAGNLIPSNSTSQEVSPAAFTLLAPLVGATVSNEYANFLAQSELYVHQSQQIIATYDRLSPALIDAIYSNDDTQLEPYRNRIPETVPEFVIAGSGDPMYLVYERSNAFYYALGIGDYVNIIPPAQPAIDSSDSAINRTIRN